MKLPPVVKVPLIRGDNATITASLLSNGEAFTPVDGSILIFSAKQNSGDEDVDALFQKLLGYGLSLSGSTATVSVVPTDSTFATAETEYAADIQVQAPDGTVTTAWLGLLVFTADTTKNLTTSLPLYTANPPLPGANGVGTVTYTHTQSVPSALWIVNHNLGAESITTTVYDIYGNEIEAEVANPTINQTRITFSTPTAGKARCF